MSEEIEVIQPHALELIERAQIDMQIATAKKYPRDLAKVKRRMLDFATLDEETAESCFYTLGRDGKTIQGPSVRLAEIAVACYGNLRAASRLIDNDGKAITSQGVCHDLENNTLISVEVKRRITKKDGKVFSDDMQVVAGNAANSIAFRNAVFKVIPGALTKPVYEAAKAVAVGNASTLATKRLKIIARLNAMEVTTERILGRLGKSSIENIGLEDLETLIGLGTAIKEGDTTVDEAFPVAPAPSKAAVDLNQFTPSADPNRGHDNTAGTRTPRDDDSNGVTSGGKTGSRSGESEARSDQATTSASAGGPSSAPDFANIDPPIEVDELPDIADAKEGEVVRFKGTVYRFHEEASAWRKLDPDPPTVTKPRPAKQGQGQRGFNL